jgi:hypothetical protein
VVSSSDVWWQGAACFIYRVFSFSSSNIYSVGIAGNCFDTVLLGYRYRVISVRPFCILTSLTNYVPRNEGVWGAWW